MYYLDFLAVSMEILAYRVYAFWSSALMLISVSDTPAIPSFGSRHIHHCVVSYKPSQYPYVLCSSVFSLWLVLPLSHPASVTFYVGYCVSGPILDISFVYWIDIFYPGIQMLCA